MSIVGPSRPGLFWLLLAVGASCVLLLDLEFAPDYLTEDPFGQSDAGHVIVRPEPTTSASEGSKTQHIPAAARVPTIVARFGNESKEPVDDYGIKALATAMIEDHDTRVVLEGHSDTVGAEDFNHDLSLERANLVKNRVVAMGVSEERIETVGLGATHPLHSDSPDAASVNRRVEVRWVGRGEFESQRKNRDAPRLPPSAVVMPSPALVAVSDAAAAPRDAGVVADAGNTVGNIVADAGGATVLAPLPAESDAGN